MKASCAASCYEHNGREFSLVALLTKKEPNAVAYGSFLRLKLSKINKKIVCRRILFDILCESSYNER